MVTVQFRFSTSSTVAYECLQLCVLDATAHERVHVAEGDCRKRDRGVAQLQTEQPEALTEIDSVPFTVLFVCIKPSLRFRIMSYKFRREKTADSLLLTIQTSFHDQRQLLLQNCIVRSKDSPPCDRQTIFISRVYFYTLLREPYAILSKAC